ncbi:MAG: ATP synthase F1 subunit delta [Bacteroidetes bacterium]|nr:MAG: ATP synthase F1 subunit delta [Bacteroidota bacterium]
MVEDRIGYRYAKSAFSLAVEQKQLDQVQADMALVHRVVEENRELRMLLDSPLVHASKKQAVLDGIFKSHYQSEITPLLVQMVVRKGRERYLPQVTHAFLSMYDEDQGIVRGVLTSAAPLSAKTQQEIKAVVEKETGKRLIMETKEDASLIGGFTLKVGDRLFDGTIVSGLRRLRQRFKHSVA